MQLELAGKGNNLRQWPGPDLSLRRQIQALSGDPDVEVLAGSLENSDKVNRSGAWRSLSSLSGPVRLAAPPFARLTRRNGALGEAGCQPGPHPLLPGAALHHTNPRQCLSGPKTRRYMVSPYVCCLNKP